MDGESSLYMCPCYKLFQSLEEVLVHQLTCQTANSATSPSPVQAEPAELYADTPAGLPPPAGPTQASLDPHLPPLDSPLAIVPDQAAGQNRPPVPPGSVVAAKPNGLLGTQLPQRAPRQASSSGSTPAAAPLIRYQCGECGLLFESLTLWQRHNKLGLCCRSTVPAPKTSGKIEDGSRVVEEKEEESVGMTDHKLKAERMEEEGDGEKEMKLEVPQCDEKPVNFDHSYQVKDMGEDGGSKDKAAAADGGQQTAEVPECSPTQNLCAEDCGATIKMESASKPSAESSPLAFSVESHVFSALEESDRTFLCVCCGAALGSLEALASHRKARHGLEGALHCCQVCGKEFMNTTLFLYHQRQHRQQGPLQPAQPSPARAGPVTQGAASHINSGEAERRETLNAAKTCFEETPAAFALPRPISSIIPSSVCLPDSRPPASAELCPICGQAFKRRCHLRVHMQCHSARKPHHCDLCPKAFTYKSNLCRHRHTHSAARAHVCPRCGRGFAQAGSLKQHTLLHERQDAQVQPREDGEEKGEGEGEGIALPYACADCPSSFHTQAQLQTHRSKHTGHYAFSCTVCGQAFLRKKRLELHALIHQGKQPLQCPSCPEQFLSQPKLDAHVPICPRNTCPSPGVGLDGSAQDGAAPDVGRRVRRRRRGQLTCELCGHRCVTQQGLDLHRLSHAGLTPLRCPRPPCRRRFASEAALQEHLSAHDAPPTGGAHADGAYSNDAAVSASAAKPRPYHCEHCGKDFTTASSLSVHLRIHTGERPFQCPQCGKRFRQIPHLRDHERLHSGERPFVCNLCGRSFVLAARLAEHARTHSGDKPYSCPLCPRTFRSLSNLGKHRKTHARAPTPASAPAGHTLPNKLAPQLGSGAAATGPQVGEAQALVLPTMGEGQAAVHTILLLHSELGSGPAFAALPLGESYSSSASTPSPSLSLSSPAPSPSAPLVLMHPSVPLSDGHHGQLGPVVSHAIEVIVTETGE